MSNLNIFSKLTLVACLGASVFTSPIANAQILDSKTTGPYDAGHEMLGHEYSGPYKLADINIDRCNRCTINESSKSDDAVRMIS